MSWSLRSHRAPQQELCVLLTFMIHSSTEVFFAVNFPRRNAPLPRCRLNAFSSLASRSSGKKLAEAVEEAVRKLMFLTETFRTGNKRWLRRCHAIIKIFVSNDGYRERHQVKKKEEKKLCLILLQGRRQKRQADAVTWATRFVLTQSKCMCMPVHVCFNTSTHYLLPIG